MNNILPYRERLEKSDDRNGKNFPFLAGHKTETFYNRIMKLHQPHA